MKSTKTVIIAAALIVGATSLAMAQVGAPNPSGNSGSGGPAPASRGAASDSMNNGGMTHHKMSRKHMMMEKKHPM